jgi:hypothetical protein
MVATDRDPSRPVATPVAPQQSAQTPPPDQATNTDEPRPTATGDNETSRYVARLEREAAGERRARVSARADRPQGQDHRLAHRARSRDQYSRARVAGNVDPALRGTKTRASSPR